MFVYLFQNVAVYHPKFSDIQVWANSVDPDQTALQEQSDQGLHCLLFHLYLLDTVLYGIIKHIVQILE